MPHATHAVCDNPIFVLGAKRSGTSLVRRLLDSHSAIACPPETYFLAHFAALANDPQTAAGLEGFGVPAGEVREEVRRWAAMYHDAYRFAQGKRRWADKTPEYLEIASQLERLFGPRAQYILVIRHPLSVTQSVAYRGLAPGRRGADALVDSARYVSHSIQRLLEHRKTHPEKCFLLYYEQLMTAPAATLRSLFDFLGEAWEETVLRFDRNPHSFGSEDPVVRGTRGFEPHFFDPASLTDAQRRAVIPILLPGMARLGHSPNRPFAAGSPGGDEREIREPMCSSSVRS